MDTSTNCPTSRLYSLDDILTLLQISPTYAIGCYSWKRQEVESSDKAKVNYPFYFTYNVSRSYRSFSHRSGILFLSMVKKNLERALYYHKQQFQGQIH